LFIVFSVFFTAQVKAAATSEKGYRLGVGEVITITTFGEPDLVVNKIKIGRNGTLNFPLIGKIEVLGKRTADIEDDIEKRLRDGYLKKPKVSVRIEDYRDFFVNGQVSKPGAYSYSPGLTVRKAIAISGGLTDRASTKKIRLKKEFDTVETLVTSLDMVMGPGDVLTIGESLF
jgi:polysaccharide export outer membrane protein